MEANKVLVILGMHRSGTSLTAQWLHACGLQLGDRLHGPDIGNTEGHYEDVDFLELHESIIRESGFPEGGYIDTPLPALQAPQQERIRKLIAAKQLANLQWGWKEPRTCLFLDLYRELLPGAKYLVVYRDFHEVVGSLVSRYFKVWHSAHFHSFPRNLPVAGAVYRKLWMKYKYAKNLTAFYRQYAETYLRICNLYNRQLLWHMESLPPGQYVLVKAGELHAVAGDVFALLTNQWGFDLEQADFRAVHKAGMYNAYADISAYINNPSVLEEAQQLQALLAAATSFS